MLRNQHPPRIDFCVGRLIEKPLGESNHPGIHPLQESVEGFGVGFWKIDLVIQCFFEQAVSGTLEERRHLADELLVDGKRSLPLTNNYFERGVVFVPGQDLSAPHQSSWLGTHLSCFASGGYFHL